MKNLKFLSLVIKLKESSIEFTRAAGNTAAFYFDAGEAVNGWLNSKDHRETIIRQVVYTYRCRSIR